MQQTVFPGQNYPAAGQPSPATANTSASDTSFSLPLISVRTRDLRSMHNRQNLHFQMFYFYHVYANQSERYRGVDDVSVDLPAVYTDLISVCSFPGLYTLSVSPFYAFQKSTRVLVLGNKQSPETPWLPGPISLKSVETCEYPHYGYPGCAERNYSTHRTSTAIKVTRHHPMTAPH